MSDTADTPQVIIRPPLVWALAVVAGFALNWLMPLPFVPAAVPAGWLGGAVFVLAVALFVRLSDHHHHSGRLEHARQYAATSIANTGPYRFTRDPIYLGMMLGLVGLAISFDNLWLLLTLVPFFLVIRYGVVAREEAYLERKFGEVYRRYRARVRRWL
jgi:protein-S-isoprenylcysteine O-methyltransferase Ste14